LPFPLCAFSLFFLSVCTCFVKETAFELYHLCFDSQKKKKDEVERERERELREREEREREVREGESFFPSSSNEKNQTRSVSKKKTFFFFQKEKKQFSTPSSLCWHETRDERGDASPAMSDSDQNCPPAAASATVVAASSLSSFSSTTSSPSPSKEAMLQLHHNQPANAAHSPLRTAVQPSAATKENALLTISEVAGFWKGE